MVNGRCVTVIPNASGRIVARWSFLRPGQLVELAARFVNPLVGARQNNPWALPEIGWQAFAAWPSNQARAASRREQDASCGLDDDTTPCSPAAGRLPEERVEAG